MTEVSLHYARGNGKEKTWVYLVLAEVTDTLLSTALSSAWNSVAPPMSGTKHSRQQMSHTPRYPDCSAAAWAQTHLWERVGFMELMEFMGGCMGSFPGGSFCRLFWWRSSKSRPSSSHHDESSAVQTEQMTVSTSEEPAQPRAGASHCNSSHKPNRQTPGVQSLSMNHHSHCYPIELRL